MGGSGKVVEADETYFGKTEEQQTVTTRGGRPFKSKRIGAVNKRAVLALVERGGTARTFHVATTMPNSVDRDHARQHQARDAHPYRRKPPLQFCAVDVSPSTKPIKHSADEYVRGDVTTNTVEGYFSIFKRGMKGVYQHCSEKHLHRYLAEFDFRYNTRTALGFNDLMRAEALAPASKASA